MTQIHFIRHHHRSLYDSVYLLNMPKIGLNNPPMAPALLQSIARDMGCNRVMFKDINLSFQEHFATNSRLLNEWCEIKVDITAEERALLEDFANTLDLDSIFSVDVVGISVFSGHSWAFTTWFLERYRKDIKGKIVVGGAGIALGQYGYKLHERNLVDYYVINEGDRAWRHILAGDLPFAGVNSEGDSLPNFDDVPVPDYTDFELDRYQNSRSMGRTIGVEGSRGCVRNCTFCDIRSFWKNYKFKDGAKLASELIHLRERFGIKHFFFNDSLMNGSDRAFRDFISVMADYNETAQEKISWSGYFIVKRAGTYKEADYFKLAKSGVKSLFIGIESGSERVRDHMKKKFNDHDIEDLMLSLQKHRIRCTWLLIIGYPSETEDDFEKTLQMLRQYQHMALDRTIDTVALGMTMSILPGSPLANLAIDLDIHSISNQDNVNGVLWYNENSNFQTRILRRIKAEKLIRELGYNSWVGDNNVVNFFEAKLKEIESGQIKETDIADYHG